MITPYADTWSHCSDCKRVITNRTGEHTCKPLPSREKRQDYARVMKDWRDRGLAECKAEIAQLTEGVE